MNELPEKITTKLGLINDQEGILKRYKREKEKWDSHANFTKKFITENIHRFSKYKVVVLGSGWLIDVPIDELCRYFSSVVLIDLHHPKDIVDKYKSQPNIKFITADITGGYIETIYNYSQHKNSLDFSTYFATFQPEQLAILNDADCIISVNILSQLDGLLCDIIQDRFCVDESLLMPFRKKIQTDHLRLLTSNKSILITDVQENIYDKRGNKITKPLIHIEMPHSSRVENWQWEFDSMGYYYPNTTVVSDVVAIVL